MSRFSEHPFQLSPTKRALFARLLQEEEGEAARTQSIPRRVDTGAVPLSFAQQRLWFLDQLDPGRAVYNMPAAWRLTGSLNVAALEQSLNAIVQRHEALRTTFPVVDGQPAQVIAPTLTVRLPIIDLRQLPLASQETQMQQLVSEEAQRPFDLARGPLIRTALLWLDDEEYVLFLALHHIVSDGWSLRVFFEELAAFYNAFVTGHPASLPELPIQYADYTLWQRQRLQGEALEGHLSYWKRQLASIPPSLDLPIDRPRPAVQTFRGAYQSWVLPTSLSEALTALSRQEGSTLFMVLLAAFQTLLYRYTGQEDIVVGTPVAGRTRSETEGLIGFFVNTLVLRTDLAGNPTFRAFLRQVRETVLEAYAHQELPFEKLVEALQPERSLSRNPLFQVMFLLENASPLALELRGVGANRLDITSCFSAFDMTLYLGGTPQGLRGTLEYNTDLFDSAMIDRMLGQYQTVLEGLLAQPEHRLAELPLLTEAERQQVLTAWNNTPVDCLQNACVHQLFETQVEQTPDAVAVLGETAQLTYAALNRRANQLAHFLQAWGVGPEVCVGICIERSLDMVVGLLGILKAGAAYVPLDPTSPKERLAFMLADARVPVLLTQQQLIAALPEHGARVVCLDADWGTVGRESETNLTTGVRPTDVAYVIYTSGSTGRPKGVQISHQAVVNHNRAVTQHYNLQPSDRILQFASVSFDVAAEEIFPSWLCGATVVLRPNQMSVFFADFIRFVETARLTVLNLPTSYWHEFVLDLSRVAISLPSSLRLVIVGSERASAERLAIWQNVVGHGVRLCHAYGPTEATITTTLYEPPADQANPGIGSVPIGRPIANTQVYVLDPRFHPVPIGVPGELYIGGAGLARGYLNRPELTAEKFIPNPFSDTPGARLYKTGDLARSLPDGNLEFLGRLDQQVKIRGYRVELGEIEAVLSQYPFVRETVVIVREDTPGEKRLVGYVVPDQEQCPTVSELHGFLLKKLPEYMLPATFVIRPTLPRTPSGKIDRRALPVPDQVRPALKDAFLPPRTPVEEMLAGIWAAVLGVERVGIHDNFFELGGHSLLAVQVMSRLRKAFQMEVPLHALFDAPTVAGLAFHVETASQDVPAPTIRPLPREELLPLSVAQEQLWGLDQRLPGTPFFNMPFALRLAGTLNVEALVQSVNEIIRRHEALRTTFPILEGKPVQSITPSLGLTVTEEDLSAFPTIEREVETQRLAREEARQPFHLAQGPLLRVRLLRLGQQEHILLVTMHHIISDGWSVDVLIHELAVLYDSFSRGIPPPLPALSIQYMDFVLWQRQWQHSEARQAQLAYWTQQLRAPLPVLQLPTDRPRTAALHLRTARHPFMLPAVLSEALTRLSRCEGSTLFMTLLAAFKILLHGYTGQEDLLVGTFVANRNRQETEELIGLFTNMVLLRTDLGGNPTLREALQRVRAITLAAYTHQDLPFEDLVRTLERERNLQRTSLCQVLFLWQPAMRGALQLSSLTVSPLEADEGVMAAGSTATTHDLVLALSERPQGLAGTCIYKPHLFDAATMSRMLKDFQYVLEHLIAQPEQRLSTFSSLLSH